jgi:hypothetical protein
MGRQVWDALKTNPDIIDRIKFSSGNSNPTLVTPQAVAALFELDEILISDVAKHHVEREHDRHERTFGFVIGKELVLFYRPKRRGGERAIAPATRSTGPATWARPRSACA